MFDNNSNNPLDFLIKRAISYGDQNNNILTAERFLLALIEVIDGTVETGNSDAYANATALLKNVCMDLGKLKKTLSVYINTDEASTVKERYHMQKVLQEAKNQAYNANSSITPELLLECLLRNPSEFIFSSILNINRRYEESKTQSDTESFNSFKKGGSSANTVEIFDDIFVGDDKKDVGKNETDKKDGNTDGLVQLTEKVKEMRDYISSKVLGQEKAINTVANGFFNSEFLKESDKKRKGPRATFLFAGPPGVGKTFLAETFAEKLGRDYKRFDMSEFSDHNAPTTFCGSNAVYSNSQPGVVTSYVDKHPKSVLLFDEIEKAHISVIYLFLQILDAGRLKDDCIKREGSNDPKDCYGKEVSFKDTIIIFTTNAGRKLYEDTTQDLSSLSRKVILKALQNDINPDTHQPYFPPAICSRFATGNVVMFNHIAAHILLDIAKNEIAKKIDMFEKETGIKVEVDDKVYASVLYAEGSSVDARTITARAGAFLNDEVFEFFRLIKPEQIKNIKSINISVDLSSSTPEITHFFYNKEKPLVMVFSDEATFEKCKQGNESCEYIFVSSIEQAKDVLKEKDIKTILLDISVDANIDVTKYLNVEDIDCPSRDFLKFIREYYSSMPVYLLETEKLELSKEEMISFKRQGVRGNVSIADGKEVFDKEMSTISDGIYRQNRMYELATSNKLLNYETAQQLSSDGTRASIKLFDFSLTVAVDSSESKTVMSNVSRPNVTFEDVIGAKSAIEELRYYVDYFKDPKQFIETGVKPPRGLIFYGPPGTGKTLLAKAMANESGVTFIATAGNEFIQKYVGEGREKVQELFKTARKYAPSIIFIDEVDAIAQERTGEANGSREKEATLTAFLAEMDGFATDPSKPVLVLAATNFDVDPNSARKLDGAFVRRFDRTILIDLPDRDDREKFLRKQIEKYPIIQINEKTFENIAVRSTGKSLADLQNVIELALRTAIRNKGKVTDDVFIEAFETYVSGDQKKWDESYLRSTSRHEAGHAFMCWYVGRTPSYMTVVARANHGGYVQHGEDTRPVLTRQELLDRICISLAGRAAEIVYYGETDGITTGASGDLHNATNVAKRIICNYGMNDEFGLAVIDKNDELALSGKIREKINAMLKEQLDRAVKIISENRASIDALVDVIMVKNHLSGEEIENILNNVK